MRSFIHILLGCFFLFSLPIAEAQSLLFDGKDVPAMEWEFNPLYIKSNRIKSIQLTKQYKPDGNRIFDKGYSEIIYFNINGYAEKSVLVLKSIGQKADTVLTWYIYSNDGKLRIKRTYDVTGYNGHYFDYDSLGNMIRQTKTIDFNLTNNPDDFKLGQQKMKWVETYKNEYFEKGKFKRTCINDIGQPYKQQVISKNALGKRTSVYSTYLITSVGSDEDFGYDNAGNLLFKTYFSNAGGNAEKYEYEYKNGQLEKEKYFVNNNFIYERFFFYSNNGVLDSEIIKHTTSPTLDLVKYQIQYY